jgi:hypothetical protein
MAVDVDLVRAYQDGLVACSAFQVINATLPTDASSALDGAFSEVGSISSDGITEQTAQDTTDVYQWQQNALVRTLKGQFTKSFVFEAQETNLITLGVQFAGSTITPTAEGLTIAEKPPVADVRNWVLHGIDGNRALRLVIPRGEVAERGDVVWSAEGVTIYAWTLRCYVDSSGNVAYRYYLDSSLSGS